MVNKTECHFDELAWERAGVRRNLIHPALNYVRRFCRAYKISLSLYYSAPLLNRNDIFFH